METPGDSASSIIIIIAQNNSRTDFIDRLPLNGKDSFGQLREMISRAQQEIIYANDLIESYLFNSHLVLAKKEVGS